MTSKYTNDQFIEAVRQSNSIRQVILRLGLSPAGGNYITVKNKVSNMGLDTSHWTGQGHLKGKTHSHNTKPINELLVNGSYYQSHKLKLRLIREGLKSHKCEQCGIVEWNGIPTPLELDHINGNNKDNRLENIRLLCPNCHAQTSTYRGKNKKTV